jgi:hypothetical protein
LKKRHATNAATPATSLPNAKKNDSRNSGLGNSYSMGRFGHLTVTLSSYKCLSALLEFENGFVIAPKERHRD